MGKQESRSPETGAAAGTGFGGRGLSNEPNRKVPQTYPKNGSESISYVDPRERFMTALKGAFIGGDTEQWYGVTVVAGVRLTLRERAALAFAVLQSLDDKSWEMTVEATARGAGAPIPPLFSYMSEAEFWAGWAAPGELDAYALACFRAMAPDRKKSFLEFIRKGGGDG